MKGGVEPFVPKSKRQLLPQTLLIEKIMFDPYFISENERWIDGWRGYYSATKDGKVKSYVNDTVRACCSV